MTPEQQNLARALTNDEGQVLVFLDGDFTKEPDLVVGTIDGEGYFHPNREEYRSLEGWLQEQERQFIQENEGVAFGLNDLVFKKANLKFAYGPDWQVLWGWDDDESVWFCKG